MRDQRQQEKLLSEVMRDSISARQMAQVLYKRRECTTKEINMTAVIR